MKENQKKYNVSDFVRYHSGTMPPDEMHALEQAALEDPFLADALDGYAFSKEPEKELDDIRIQLSEKRKQKKVVTISSLSSSAWWKIAAMFIVIAGAGYFFFFINSQKENSLSVKENLIKKEKAEIISRAKGDSSTTETNIAFEKPLTKENKTNRAKLPKPAAKPIQIPQVKNTAREEEIKREKNLSEKHLTDTKKKAIVMSSDKIRPADITLTDLGEKPFSDSSDIADMAATAPSPNLKDSANTVAMNKTAPSLQDVVIVGYGTQRKSAKVGSVQSRATTPYLREGKEKFDQYIKDNAAAISDAGGEKLSADILLSFSLNKKGNPVNIKVLESSCKPCETEAIKLLKEGPKWVGKSGARGTVRIRF